MSFHITMRVLGIHEIDINANFRGRTTCKGHDLNFTIILIHSVSLGGCLGFHNGSSSTVEANLF